MNTILIVDDHAGFRIQARALLEAERFSVIGEAADAASGLQAARSLHPDLVLLDIGLPDLEGFDVADQLAINGPPPFVVLISSRDASEYGSRVATSRVLGFIAKEEPDVAIVDIRMPPTHTDEGLQAASAIRAEHETAVGVLVLSQYVEASFALRLVADGAGGVGYLLKDRVEDLDDFVDAIRRIAHGGWVIDPEVVAQLVARRHTGVPLDGTTHRTSVGSNRGGATVRRTYVEPAWTSTDEPQRSASSASSVSDGAK